MNAKTKVLLILLVLFFGKCTYDVVQNRERRSREFLDLFSQYVYSKDFEIESLETHMEVVTSSCLNFEMWIRISGDFLELKKDLSIVKNNDVEIRSVNGFGGIVEYKNRCGEYDEYLWNRVSLPDLKGKIYIVGVENSNLFYVYGWTY